MSPNEIDVGYIRILTPGKLRLLCLQTLYSVEYASPGQQSKTICRKSSFFHNKVENREILALSKKKCRMTIFTSHREYSEKHIFLYLFCTGEKEEKAQKV
jgi:hypothetical protein